MPNTTLPELLARAQSLWRTTRRGYRDGMIEVGSLLLRHIRERLSTGDSLNESERRRAGISRAALTAECARALSVRLLRVNELIRLAVVSELLAPDGGFGSLSFTSVRLLRRAVHRPYRGQISRTKDATDSLPRLSRLEEWSVRPEYAATIRPLVARAVSESWHERQLRSALAAFRPPGVTRGPHKNDPGLPLTTGRIAKMLCVAPRTVSKWVDTGALPGYKLPGGGDRRVLPLDFLDFVRSCNMPIPASISAGESIAFGLDSVPPGFTQTDAFDLGFFAATKRIKLALIGDADGAQVATRAVAFIRSSSPGAVIILVVSPDRAGEPFSPDPLTRRVIAPLDALAIQESL